MILAAGLPISIRDGAAMKQSALLVLAAPQNEAHADLLALNLLRPGLVTRFGSRRLLVVIRAEESALSELAARLGSGRLPGLGAEALGLGWSRALTS